MTAEALLAQYGPLVEELSTALAQGDAIRAGNALDTIVQLRESALLADLSKLTGDLQGALDRFRLAHFAAKEIPNARQRLDHVVKMTDAAAHKTMDLIEQSAPIADRLFSAATSLAELWQAYRNHDANSPDLRALVERTTEFLGTAQFDSDTMRRNLNDVLMAQGYQDLTGQIIRNVIQLVGSIEAALVDLARLSRSKHAETSDLSVKSFGPPVPGVDKGNFVNGQQDVDSLLSGLGL